MLRAFQLHVLGNIIAYEPECIFKSWSKLQIHVNNINTAWLQLYNTMLDIVNCVKFDRSVNYLFYNFKDNLLKV